MQPKEILKQMLQMQQKLNDQTNGIGWENGYTKNDKLINWKRCIYMECAELVDSFAWKHWKEINRPTDWDNVRVEIVDIWHFVMSLMLEIYKNNNLGDLDKLVDDVSNATGFKSFCKDASLPSKDEELEIVNDIENLIHLTTGFNINLFDGLIRAYFYLSLKCGINLNNLYTFYVAKNVLNQFRQDNGYKEGTYRKIWNGKEDNEVMIDLLNEKENISIDDIYKSLDSIYKASA